MKYLFACIAFLLVKVSPIERRDPLLYSISKSALKDKIKGGWAGQVIGVAFANSQALEPNPLSALNKGFVEASFRDKIEEFDDLFLDIASLEVVEKTGYDASPVIFANAYAQAEYTFSHANQVGRYNFLHGVKPPLSGHWINNPHAEDVDFQMQADFIGLMSPGMPAAASKYSNKVGHIMSSGDGYYAGLYVATLYSLAFTQKDVKGLVEKSIIAIPHRTKFYECITQAIVLYHEFPNDWKRAKLELLKDWSNGIKCPSATQEENTDAKLSSAFVTLSLLYGNLDFARTMEIAASLCRTSDTHVASVAGVLGTRLGYSKIPNAWKEGIVNIESVNFLHTETSLQEAYEMSYRHALRSIERHAGKQKGNEVLVALKDPVPTSVERSFESHNISEIRSLDNQIIAPEFEFSFEGIGFLLKGDVITNDAFSDYSLNADVYIDNRLEETIDLPVKTSLRRTELLWKYQLAHGKHVVKIRVLNPSQDHQLKVTDLVVYDISEVTLSRLPR
jgi:hypothetical protein